MLHRNAFTLVELLVVVGIIAVLASMLVPVLGMAQRQSRNTATQGVMHKVDTALRLFRNEIGSYPWQDAYRSQDELDAGQRQGNRLHHHLDSTPAATDLAQVIADADTAAATYGYRLVVTGSNANGQPTAWGESFSCDGGATWTVASPPPSTPPAGSQAFHARDVRPVATNNKSIAGSKYLAIDKTQSMVTAVHLNRVAAERARRSLLAGNAAMTGVVMPDLRTDTAALWTDAATGWTFTERSPSLSTVRLVPAPGSSKPGWSADYLDGELEARHVDGASILDAYRRPLVYICQVIPGVHVAPGARGLYFGVGNTEPAAYGLQSQGRHSLASYDLHRRNAPLVDNPPALPSAAEPIHSDRRSYAAPGFEMDFELWSCGPDGVFAWMRDDPRNRDNLPLIPYDKGLR